MHLGSVQHTRLQVGMDPDFHHGDPSPLSWFVAFMSAYMTPRQLACITAQTVALLALGIPLPNVVLFTAACPIASAWQLFCFGTYLPHKPAPGHRDWPEECSRTSTAPTWLTTLQCYNVCPCYHCPCQQHTLCVFHLCVRFISVWFIYFSLCPQFGLHKEHHAWPAVPWYLLPAARQACHVQQASADVASTSTNEFYK